MSFALGVKFVRIIIWDDDDGEVMPECSRCESCVAYYEKHNPKDDEHAKRIQDDIQREIAVAVAGEIAEVVFTNGSVMINPEEVEVDRRRAREWACFLHIWSNRPAPCRWSDPCDISDPFLATIRRNVEQLLREPKTWRAVSVLASHLKNSPEPCTSWSDAADLIEKNGVLFESIPLSSLASSR